MVIIIIKTNEWYLILVEERWACCESRAWKEEAGIQVPQMFWIKISCNFYIWCGFFVFLETVMHDSHIEGTPLLILANKQDLQVCCSFLPEFSGNLYTITAFCCVYVQLVSVNWSLLFEILSILGAKPELKVLIILLNQSSVQKTFLSTEWHNSVQVTVNVHV